AKLAVSACMNFVVLDATGSNLFLDVSSVLSTAVHMDLVSGAETTVTKQPPGTISSDLFNVTQTEAITLTYDDSGKGGSNLIIFYGILSAKGSGDLEKSTRTALTLTGTGYATVNGKSSILKGTMVANAPGVCD